MSLINSEINLDLNWSEIAVASNADQETTFSITDTKLYVPVVTLSTQDNAKLLDYNYFKSCYKMIAIDLSKQQALDADLKAIQQISFTVNLEREGNANKTVFFIIEEAKELF